MKLGIVQMPVVHDKSVNVNYAAEAVAAAVKNEAELAVLPEMFCCPYSNAFFSDYAEPQGGMVWSAMSKTASDNRVWLVAGSMPERDGEHVYNTSFVFDPSGRQVARHRKAHLFDIDVQGGQRFFESETFTPGGGITAFETPWGKMGLCVCFDMRFPELARVMALDGCQMIIVPGAFNMTTGPAHWELMFRQRAVDNQLFTVGVAPARDNGGVYVSYGNSIAVSPWGNVVFRAGAEACSEVIDIDLSLNQKIREQLPLLSARRTDLYKCAAR